MAVNAQALGTSFLAHRFVGRGACFWHQKRCRLWVTIGFSGMSILHAFLEMRGTVRGNIFTYEVSPGTEKSPDTQGRNGILLRF